MVSPPKFFFSCDDGNKAIIQMRQQADLNQYKQQVIADFNARTNYDNEFRYRFAEPLVDLAQLQKGQHVLDIATGTGIVAIAAAQIVGNQGKVIGVDISSGMLAQAQRKIEAAGLQNIELIEADAEYLNFPDDSFDAILCSSAIVYLTDIPASLQQWYRFLKPGGIVAFSCLAQTAVTASILFRSKAQKYGVTITNPNEILDTPEKCQNLLEAAGFQDIKIVTQQFGGYFTNAQHAWQANANNAFGSQVFQLAPDKLEQLKAEYIAEIEAIATEPEFGNDFITFFVLAHK